MSDLLRQYAGEWQIQTLVNVPGDHGARRHRLVIATVHERDVVALRPRDHVRVLLIEQDLVRSHTIKECPTVGHRRPIRVSATTAHAPDDVSPNNVVRTMSLCPLPFVSDKLIRRYFVSVFFFRVIFCKHT